MQLRIEASLIEFPPSEAELAAAGSGQQRLSNPFGLAYGGTQHGIVNLFGFIRRKLRAKQHVFLFAFRQCGPSHFRFHTFG
jgi:hypothetical protein